MLAAADQRQHRRQPRQPGELVEEIVLRSEHDRGTEDRRLRERLAHALFAQRLGPGIARRARCARRRAPRHAAAGPRRSSDAARAIRSAASTWSALEALAAALVEHRDEIDRRIGALQRRAHRVLVLDIGLDELDLADPAHRLQEQRVVGPAHRDADAPAVIGERAHHVPAEEARAAEDGDKPRGGNAGHGSGPRSAIPRPQ